MKFEVVKAGAEHIEDIVEIENLSFAIPWSHKAVTDEIVSNKFATYYCAVIDGRVVGYAGTWHVCDEGHITNIAVHPDFRGYGIGDALMEKLIEYAREEGIVGMTLEVRKNNIAARSLYRKYGFIDEGVRKAYYADNGEDAIIMWNHTI